MMKASLKGKYEYDADKAATSAISTLAIPVGDFKLRTSLTDATFLKGPSLNGLLFSLEKPGFFIFDYNVPTKVPFFSFSYFASCFSLAIYYLINADFRISIF